VKRYRYMTTAALVGLGGYLITAFAVFGFGLWAELFALSPVAIGTGMWVAHKFRSDIRADLGWMTVLVSIFIGIANVLLFYGIVAGVGGFVIGLVMGIPALLQAAVYSAIVSPFAYFAMRLADRWEISNARTT
jgi:hypothetical protein